MNDQITADDVLQLVQDRAQYCRENGESDMRNIIHMVSAVRASIADGKSRDAILKQFAIGEDDE